MKENRLQPKEHKKNSEPIHILSVDLFDTGVAWIGAISEEHQTRDLMRSDTLRNHRRTSLSCSVDLNAADPHVSRRVHVFEDVVAEAVREAHHGAPGELDVEGFVVEGDGQLVEERQVRFTHSISVCSLQLNVTVLDRVSV